MNQVLAEVGVLHYSLGGRAIKATTTGFFDKPLIRRHEKAASPAGRIADLELTGVARVRLHAAHNRLDEEPRSEVLAGSLLSLTGGLLEQTFERLGFDINPELRPMGLVDQAR